MGLEPNNRPVPLFSPTDLSLCSRPQKVTWAFRPVLRPYRGVLLWSFSLSSKRQSGDASLTLTSRLGLGNQKSTIDPESETIQHGRAIGQQKTNDRSDIFAFSETAQGDSSQHRAAFDRIAPGAFSHLRQNDSRINRIYGEPVGDRSGCQVKGKCSVVPTENI
jgi:hypothetical protein